MAGEMTTDVSTGAAVTVTASDPDVVTEPATAVAVIVADPAPTAVTSPVDDTPATLGAELVQLIVAEIAVPAWSLATALNCSVCPAASELLAPVGCVTETVVRIGAGLDGIDGPPPESPPPEQAATRSSAPTRQRFVPRRGTKFRSPGSRSRPARAVRPATPSVPMNRSIRVVLVAVVFIAAIALAQKPHDQVFCQLTNVSLKALRRNFSLAGFSVPMRKASVQTPFNEKSESSWRRSGLRGSRPSGDSTAQAAPKLRTRRVGGGASVALRPPFP